jgi:hypothetical protein
MDEKPSFRPFLIPMLFLLVVGWGGLALLMNFTLPELWPRWGFFALIVMAFTGSALPVTFLVNQRLLSNEAHVVTRQALWVGIYAALLAWLQIGDILNFSVALWLVLGFLAVEFLFQLRKRPAKPPVIEE